MFNDIPNFNNISQEKIDALKNIVQSSNNIPSNQLVPFLMNAARKANEQGIYFSDDETEMIINTIKLNMSPSEISKLDNILRLTKIIHGNQKNNI